MTPINSPKKRDIRLVDINLIKNRNIKEDELQPTVPEPEERDIKDININFLSNRPKPKFQWPKFQNPFSCDCFKDWKFNCELPKIKLPKFPCWEGKSCRKVLMGCCTIRLEWPKYGEKYEKLNIDKVKYDKFMPDHIHQLKSDQGFDLSMIISSYITEATSLQNRIRGQRQHKDELSCDYNDLVDKYSKLMSKRLHEYNINRQKSVTESRFVGGEVGHFRGDSYLMEYQSGLSNQAYMREQSKMLVQMIFRANNQYRLATPCFIAARVKAAIRMNQMNKF